MNTDKSKPWLNAKHPEAIACKNAGKKLFDVLAEAGVHMTGVGVGLSDDKQEAVIRVYLLNEADKPKVPTTFNGYQVKTTVTGTIKAL